MVEIWCPESIALQRVNLLLAGLPHLAVCLRPRLHFPLCHLLLQTWIRLLYLVFQIRSFLGTRWCLRHNIVNILKISRCRRQWLVPTMAHFRQCLPWTSWWTDDGGSHQTPVQVYLQCSKTFVRLCSNKLLLVSWICGGVLGKGAPSLSPPRRHQHVLSWEGYIITPSFRVVPTLPHPKERGNLTPPIPKANNTNLHKLPLSKT